MSIYFVNLHKWYPRPSRFNKGADRGIYDALKIIIRFSRCYACKGPVKYNRAIGYHALPFGYSSEIYCSTKCYGSELLD